MAQPLAIAEILAVRLLGAIADIAEITRRPRFATPAFSPVAARRPVRPRPIAVVLRWRQSGTVIAQ